MTHKTFTFRSGFASWSNHEGHTATLFGGFYSYYTARSFKKIRVVKLAEKLPKPSMVKDDTWYIQADADTIQRTLKLVEHDAQWQKPELIITGTNRSVESLTPYMGASND